MVKADAMTARGSSRRVAVLVLQALKIAAAEPAITLMNSRRLTWGAPSWLAFLPKP